MPARRLVGQSAPGRHQWRPGEHGFDAVTLFKVRPAVARIASDGRRAPDWWVGNALERAPRVPAVFSYRRWAPFIPAVSPHDELSFPSVLPNWDNTPRAGARGMVYQGSTPELFGAQVRTALALLTARPADDRVLFIRSWNEWAEGNHLEPDRRFGRGYLEAFRDAVAGFTPPS